MNTRIDEIAGRPALAWAATVHPGMERLDRDKTHASRVSSGRLVVDDSADGLSDDRGFCRALSFEDLLDTKLRALRDGVHRKDRQPHAQAGVHGHRCGKANPVEPVIQHMRERVEREQRASKSRA